MENPEELAERPSSIILKCRSCKRQFILGSDAFVVTVEAIISLGDFDKSVNREMLESSAGTDKNPDQVFPEDDHYGNVALFKAREIQDSQISNIKDKIIGGSNRYWKCWKCRTLNRYKKTIVRTKDSFDPRWWRFW